MLSGRLKKLTELMCNRSPAAQEAIKSLEAAIGRRLPKDYKEYLSSSNGGRGNVAGSTILLDMEPAEKIVERTKACDIELGLWVIGSDTMGKAILLDCREEKSVFTASGFADMENFGPTTGTFGAFLTELVKLAPARRATGDSTKGVSLPPAGTSPPVEICRIEEIYRECGEPLWGVLSPRGDRYYTSISQVTRCWEIPTGKKRYELFRTRVIGITDSGELLTFLFGEDCQTELVWREAETGRILRRRPRPANCVFESFSASSRLALLQTRDGLECVDLEANASLNKLAADSTRWNYLNGWIFRSGKFCLVGDTKDLSVRSIPDFHELCAIRHPEFHGEGLGNVAIALNERSLIFSMYKRVAPAKSETPVPPGDAPNYTYTDATIFCHELPSAALRFTMPVMRRPCFGYAQFAWHPDGRTLLGLEAFEGTIGALAEYDATTGEALRVISNDRLGCYMQPQLSGDGAIAATRSLGVKEGESVFVRIWRLR